MTLKPMDTRSLKNIYLSPELLDNVHGLNDVKSGLLKLPVCHKSVSPLLFQYRRTSVRPPLPKPRKITSEIQKNKFKVIRLQNGVEYFGRLNRNLTLKEILGGVRKLEDPRILPSQEVGKVLIWFISSLKIIKSKTTHSSRLLPKANLRPSTQQKAL